MISFPGEPETRLRRKPCRTQFDECGEQLRRSGADARATIADPQSALLARAAAGDERALEELYDLYGPVLYGYAVRRLNDHDLAQELVQRVMTRMWLTADRYDGSRGSVRTWVFTMARSSLLDLIRRRRRKGSVMQLRDHADDIDELEQLLRAEAMRVALDRLSTEHRQVLDLAYFGGLSQTEVATRLGLPVGTVKSRTYYALKALRLACEELGVLE